MANLYVLAGIPGSGKSTWAKQFLPHANVVSSDALRIELLGKVYDQSKNQIVFDEFHKRIEEGLRGYGAYDVVADATSLTRQSRERLIGIARKTNSRVLLVLFTNYGEAFLRNSKREADKGLVPDDVMHTKMLPRLESTIMDYREEDFDDTMEVSRYGK